MKKIHDITTNKSARVNISYSPVFNIPLIKIVKYVAVGTVIVSFFTGFVQAPQLSLVSAQTDQSASSQAAERAQLEAQLQQYEQQIAQTQQTIDDYRKKGNTLSGEIATLNAQINKLNLQIKAINVNLSQLNNDINDTQVQINQTENNIDQHKAALAENLQAIYESDQQSLLTILLAHDQLSDFFDQMNSIQLVQSNIKVSLDNITKLRQSLLDQKQELSLEKQDSENLKAIQQSQKQGIQSTQTQKNQLLTVTKGKESEYQKILTQTQAQAAKIRARIFQLLGGGQLSFEKAYEYAKLAEKATGVRAALILGVLDRESKLGANTGKCSYNSTSRSGTTNMNPKEIPIFLSILSSLGIDPNSTYALISCPNADGTYGGAMGPAQFIPSTWKAYSSQISQTTGNNPANPWNNSDAFVATGLYLKNYGADSQNPTDEKKAAAIYYCGANWKLYSCSYYAGKVIDNANGFQDDINTLNKAS